MRDNENWYWHKIEVKMADGTAKAEWFHGSSELATKVAIKSAGPRGTVVSCDPSEIPDHVRCAGWRTGDLPRSYQA